MKKIIIILGIVVFCIFVAYATKQTSLNESKTNNIDTFTPQNLDVNNSNTITKKYNPIMEKEDD